MTKTAYKNQHLEIRKVTNHAKEINGYYYSHEVNCDGSMAVLLPFRFGKGNRAEYLLRKELIPCWDIDRTCLSAITGTADDLWEKTGFLLNPLSKRFKFLGGCYGSKRSDTRYRLFAVNVHGLTQEPAEGNGTPLDDMAQLVWVVGSTIGMALDPLVYILHYRTARYIRRIARPRVKGNPSRTLAGIHAF